MVRRIRKRSGWACAIVLACGLLASPAAAQQKPVPSSPAHLALAQVLTVEPGASCLARDRLIAHVKMWLGGDRVDAAVRVRVHGDPADPRTLWFELERDGQSSRRSFEPAPDSCEDTHAVLGLSIAMAIDAERMQDTLAPLPTPPRLVLLSVQPSLAYDVLPGVSLGVLIGGELGLLPWLGLRADALAHYSWDDTIAGSTGHFDALLAGGSLQMCTGGRADPKLRIALCVGLASGALHAWGTDYAPSHAETGLWLGVRSGLRFHFTLGIDWLLDVDVMSAIISPAFTAERGAMELARQPSSTGFMVSLGPALSL